MTTIDNIMALANAYAESYRDALAPNVNALVDEAQTALRTALTDSRQEAFARGMAVRPARASQPARVPVAITRDDTEHGMYYYRASEVDALMAAQPVREPANWYCIDKSGMATLCADEDDALQNAKLAARDWPNNAPYRAVQLVENTTRGIGGEQ